MTPEVAVIETDVPPCPRRFPAAVASIFQVGKDSFPNRNISQEGGTPDCGMFPTSRSNGLSGGSWEGAYDNSSCSSGSGGGFGTSIVQQFRYGHNYPQNLRPPRFPHALHTSIEKTRLCVHRVKGGCVRPDCPFAHSEEELRAKPDLAKTKLCHAFTMEGRCAKGSDCKYAHGEDELRATPEFFKTALCLLHKNGQCKAGPLCRFAHGMEEIRSRPSPELYRGKLHHPYTSEPMISGASNHNEAAESNFSSRPPQRHHHNGNFGLGARSPSQPWRNRHSRQPLPSPLPGLPNSSHHAMNNSNNSNNNNCSVLISAGEGGGAVVIGRGHSNEEDQQGGPLGDTLPLRGWVDDRAIPNRHEMKCGANSSRRGPPSWLNSPMAFAVNRAPAYSATPDAKFGSTAAPSADGSRSSFESVCFDRRLTDEVATTAETSPTAAGGELSVGAGLSLSNDGIAATPPGVSAEGRRSVYPTPPHVSRNGRVDIQTLRLQGGAHNNSTGCLESHRSVRPRPLGRGSYSNNATMNITNNNNNGSFHQYPPHRWGESEVPTTIAASLTAPIHDGPRRRIFKSVPDLSPPMGGGYSPHEEVGVYHALHEENNNGHNNLHLITTNNSIPNNSDIGNNNANDDNDHHHHPTNRLTNNDDAPHHLHHHPSSNNSRHSNSASTTNRQQQQQQQQQQRHHLIHHHQMNVVEHQQNISSCYSEFSPEAHSAFSPSSSTGTNPRLLASLGGTSVSLDFSLPNSASLHGESVNSTSENGGDDEDDDIGGEWDISNEEDGGRAISAFELTVDLNYPRPQQSVQNDVLESDLPPDSCMLRSSAVSKVPSVPIVEIEPPTEVVKVASSHNPTPLREHSPSRGSERTERRFSSPAAAQVCLADLTLREVADVVDGIAAEVPVDSVARSENAARGFRLEPPTLLTVDLASNIPAASVSLAASAIVGGNWVASLSRNEAYPLPPPMEGVVHGASRTTSTATAAAALVTISTTAPAIVRGYAVEGEEAHMLDGVDLTGKRHTSINGAALLVRTAPGILRSHSLGVDGAAKDEFEVAVPPGKLTVLERSRSVNWLEEISRLKPRLNEVTLARNLVWAANYSD